MLRGLWQRWRRQREDKSIERRAIPDALWQLTLARYPFLAQRSPDDLQALRDMTSLFLDQKEFHGAQGFDVTDDIAVAVAAQACVPVLQLGLDAYRRVYSIIMHADEVVARREVVDDDGVVHTYDDELLGEMFTVETGQIMLAWSPVRDAHELAEWGCNVVIHEFAHVLDALNGELDGIPGPMPAGDQRHWAGVLEAEYDAFCDRVDAGEDTALDPYGAEALDEFFAVAAEAFFVAPLAMKKEQPALYRLLSGYFRQDPAALP